MWNNNQKLKEYIIYALPVLFLVVGIWAFLNVISMHYIRAISLIDWLLSGSDNIIATVRDVDTVMGRLQRIMLMRAFWVLWFAGFSVSIFMLGKHVHNKKEQYSEHAEIRGKDAYGTVKEIIIKNHKKLQAADCITLNKKINALAERVKFESDFGYGDLSVIDCENQIDKRFYDLAVLLAAYEPDLDNGQAVESVLDEINMLLDQRAEMKKRH